MKNLITLIIILAIFTSIASGQKNLRPGYIIDLKKDTIRGFIDYRNDILSSEKCVFYQNVNSEPTTYMPGEIDSYRVEEGRYYVSRNIKIDKEETVRVDNIDQKVKTGTIEKTVFLEYLVNGITSLYYLKTGDSERYFIQKGEELYELSNNVSIIKQGNDQYFKPSNQFKGMMRVVYSDSKEIVPSINSSRFDRASMMKLSEKYHNLVCTDRKCIVYEKDKKGIMFDFGPAVRYEYSTAKFENHLAGFTFDAGQVISFGIAMNMRMVSINEKFNVGMVLMVGNEKNVGIKTSNYLTGKDVTTLNIEKTGLQTNLILKYQYPKGKIRPSIGLGPDLNIILKRNSNEVKRTYNLAGDLLVGPTTTTTVINYKYEIGIAANAGFYLMLKKNMISFDLFYKLGKETYREIGTISGKGDVSRDAIINAFGISTAFYF